MTAPPPLTRGVEHRRILAILSGLMLGMFLASLDQTIVSTAMRTIADRLDGQTAQAWATTAYLVTSTVSTPLYGKLSDIYGRKPFYLFAIVVFVVGSVPLYVAGLSLLLLPGILVVLVAFFISIAWWTTGAYELLEVPRGEGAEFVTVSLLGASSALFVCSTAFPF